MSDTTTPGAAKADAGSALSLPQAVQMLAERRAAREASPPPSSEAEPVTDTRADSGHVDTYPACLK